MRTFANYENGLVACMDFEGGHLEHKIGFIGVGLLPILSSFRDVQGGARFSFALCQPTAR